MATPDFFGILDKVRRLSPPAGLEAAHLDGFSWAKNDISYGNSTKLTPDDWNRIIANLRGVLTGAGLDLNNLDPNSPLLAREAIKGYIQQAIPGGIEEALPIIEAALNEAAGIATAAAASAAADAVRAELAADQATQQATLAGAYDTKAEADTHLGDFTEGQSIQILADGANNGTWTKKAGVWVKTNGLTLASLGSWQIIAAGLATGGGDLSATRTITVPAATPEQAVAGTADDVAMTPQTTRVVTEQWFPGVIEAGEDLIALHVYPAPAGATPDTDPIGRVYRKTTRSKGTRFYKGIENLGRSTRSDISKLSQIVVTDEPLAKVSRTVDPVRGIRTFEKVDPRAMRNRWWSSNYPKIRRMLISDEGPRSKVLEVYYKDTTRKPKDFRMEARLAGFQPNTPPDPEPNPDIVVPIQRPVSPCAAYITPEGRRYWILGGRQGSWWVRGNWQFQEDFYTSGMSSLPIRWDQRIDGAKGKLLGYQMLRGSGNFECIEVGEDIDGGGVDDHNKFAFILDPRTAAVFPVMVMWTNHGGIAKRMLYSNSRDLKGLGAQVTVTPDSKYTYMQPARRYDNLDEIWSWSRQAIDDGVFWGANISTDNGRNWSAGQKIFARVDHYLNSVHRRDGQGWRCFHHINPSTGSSSNDIKMTSVGWDARVSSYAAGTLGNFKDPGYSPINVFTVNSDIILDPPAGKRPRMTSAVEVEANVYHVGYVIGDMVTDSDHMLNSRAMVAIVDCRTALEGSVAPIVTHIDLGPAGKNLSTYETALGSGGNPYSEANKTYLGGVAIVGTAENPNLALVAANDRDNDGKSYLELIDYSNPSVLKKRTVREAVAPVVFGRPEVWLKVNYDGTNIWYDNGDLCEAWFGRYQAFAYFRTDGITIPTAEWLP